MTGSITASTTAVAAGATTFSGAVGAGGLSAGGMFVANNISSFFNRSSQTALTQLYRAVGENEFKNIMQTSKFSIEATGRSMEAKQFGLSLSETLTFAQRFKDTAAIIQVKIPTNVLSRISDLTHVDTSIFKSGTITIQAEHLEEFNRFIQQLTAQIIK